MRALRTFALAAVTALGAALPVARAGAQALGPQRQFLAIEPYYEYTRFKLDDIGTSGSTGGTTNLNGYGARLWINGAPFHFPLNSAIALFTTYAPSTSASQASALHYGAQIDQFFVRRPFGGVIDPFVSVTVGAFRRHFDSNTTSLDAGTTNTHFAVAPGGGIRIPLPNRFELRGDVRDLIIVNGGTTVNGATTTNNLVVQGGLGITF